ncbi:hypothetical protein HDV05_008814 [Chytridiales sp. JEL 0842]|nr:hypothetical protein HDV05_008814 [Chytridiales sp. JEL 0842]
MSADQGPGYAQHEWVQEEAESWGVEQTNGGGNEWGNETVEAYNQGQQEWGQNTQSQAANQHESVQEQVGSWGAADASGGANHESGSNGTDETYAPGPKPASDHAVKKRGSFNVNAKEFRPSNVLHPEVPAHNAAPGSNNAFKKKTYYNPKRYLTGGFQKAQISSDDLERKMAEIRRKNEAIIMRQMQIEEDERLFAEAQMRDQMRMAEHYQNHQQYANADAALDYFSKEREENARRKAEVMANTRSGLVSEDWGTHGDGFKAQSSWSKDSYQDAGRQPTYADYSAPTDNAGTGRLETSHEEYKDTPPVLQAGFEEMEEPVHEWAVTPSKNESWADSVDEVVTSQQSSKAASDSGAGAQPTQAAPASTQRPETASSAPKKSNKQTAKNDSKPAPATAKVEKEPSAVSMKPPPAKAPVREAPKHEWYVEPANEWGVAEDSAANEWGVEPEPAPVAHQAQSVKPAFVPTPKPAPAAKDTVKPQAKNDDKPPAKKDVKPAAPARVEKKPSTASMKTAPSAPAPKHEWYVEPTNEWGITEDSGANEWGVEPEPAPVAHQAQSVKPAFVPTPKPAPAAKDTVKPQAKNDDKPPAKKDVKPAAPAKVEKKPSTASMKTAPSAPTPKHEWYVEPTNEWGITEDSGANEWGVEPEPAPVAHQAESVKPASVPTPKPAPAAKDTVKPQAKNDDKPPAKKDAKPAASAKVEKKPSSASLKATPSTPAPKHEWYVEPANEWGVIDGAAANEWGTTETAQQPESFKPQEKLSNRPGNGAFNDARRSSGQSNGSGHQDTFDQRRSYDNGRGDNSNGGARHHRGGGLRNAASSSFARPNTRASEGSVGSKNDWSPGPANEWPSPYEANRNGGDKRDAGEPKAKREAKDAGGGQEAANFANVVKSNSGKNNANGGVATGVKGVSTAPPTRPMHEWYSEPQSESWG